MDLDTPSKQRLVIVSIRLPVVLDTDTGGTLASVSGFRRPGNGQYEVSRRDVRFEHQGRMNAGVNGLIGRVCDFF